MVTPVYPATNNAEAIELNISNANQFFTVLQGDIDTTIPTYEGNGEIPSVAKALNEAAAYKVPLAWQTTGEETDLLQPRNFDGDIYVPLSVPAPFSGAPSADFWRLYSLNADKVLADTLFFDGDGVTKDFSVPSATIDDPSAYLVSISGVVQRPTIDYDVNVATDTLSFVEAPPAPSSGSHNISVTLLGDFIGGLSERIYENVTEGLGRTPEGQYFQVKGVDPEIMVDLYKNSSGSAVLIDSYPNKFALDNAVDTLNTSADSLTDFVNSSADAVRRISDLESLRTATPRFQDDVAYMVGRTTAGDGGEGEFRWDGSDLSTEVLSDPESVSYVPPDSDPTGASGAWVRQGLLFGAVPEMIGAFGDGVTDETALINALESSGVKVVLQKGKTYSTTKVEVSGDYEGLGALILASPLRAFSPQIITGRKLTPPPGFSFSPLILPVFRNGRWRGDSSAISHITAPTGATYYVDVYLGDDGNAGTEAAPLKSIETALEKADVGYVMVAPGWYDRQNNWGSASITTTSSVFVQPWRVRSGRVINSTSWPHIETDWTKDATYDRVYSATRSSVQRVLDTAMTEQVLADGRPYTKYREYVEVGSVVDCNNLSGSWYSDGTTLYVNPVVISKTDEFPTGDTYTTAGAEAAFKPSDNIKVLLSETNAFFNDDIGLYAEGIDFVGGDEGFWFLHTATGHTETAAFSDCGFYYASDPSDGNGLRVDGGEMQVIIERCAAMFNRLDGFNHHDDGGGAPDIIEINCVGLFNGDGGTGNNNGSTIHDGLNILRIGGLYGAGEGPSVADVGGGDSWNCGSVVLPSYRIDDAITKSSLYNSGCDMWAYECDILESENNGAAVTSSGVTRLHNTEAKSTVESGGTFDWYVQS